MTRQRKKKWSINVALLVWIVVFAIKNLSTLEGIDLSSVDYAARLRISRGFRRDVLLVPITSDDFKQLFHRKCPLDPGIVIQIVNVIASGKPKIIAVDLDTSDPQYKTLVDTGKVKPTVPIIWAAHATNYVDGNITGPIDLDTVLGHGVTQDPGPDRLFLEGIIDLPQSAGVIRSYKRIFETRHIGRMDSLAFGVLRYVCSQNREAGCRMLIECDSEKRSACTEPVLIRYSNDTTTALTEPSAGHLLNLAGTGNHQSEGSLRRILENKVVFLGGWFPESGDLHDTPAGLRYGVAIHAEAFASERANETTQVGDRWWIVGAELGALLLLIFAERRIKKATKSVAFRVWVALFGIAFFSVGLSLAAFGRIELFLSFVPLLGGVFLDVISDLASEAI